MKKFIFLFLIIFLFAINLKAQQDMYCGNTYNVSVGEVFNLHTDCTAGFGGVWVYEYAGSGTIGLSGFGCDQGGSQDGTDPSHSYASAGTYIAAYHAFGSFPGCGVPCCQITINVGAAAPPSCTSYNSPSDGAKFVSINPTLDWNAEGTATGYKLYFGTDATATNIHNGTDIGNVTTYAPGSLNYNTTYYWKIVPYNGGGDAAGPCNIWSFTTEIACPSNPSPADGATGVSINQDVSWDAVAGATSYDVYFGPSGSPVFVGNQAGTTYDPGALNYSTTYDWYILSKNADGTTSGCDTWSFTTADDPTPDVGGIAVNDNGAIPNIYAILDADISTNNKGILIPRITSAQRTSFGGMGASEEGLTVYDTDTDTFWLWDGSSWHEFAMASKNNKKIDELERKIEQQQKIINQQNKIINQQNKKIEAILLKINKL